MVVTVKPSLVGDDTDIGFIAVGADNTQHVRFVTAGTIDKVADSERLSTAEVSCFRHWYGAKVDALMFRTVSELAFGGDDRGESFRELLNDEDAVTEMTERFRFYLEKVAAG